MTRPSGHKVNGPSGPSALAGKVVRCKPMLDEVVWSHTARFAWLNGAAVQSELSLATSVRALSPLREPSWLALMAEFAETSLPIYLARHSSAALLDLEVYEGGNLRSVGHSFATYEGLKPNHGVAMACPKCRDDDVASHGFSWFRRMHQLPGMLRCNQHGCDLHEVLGTKPTSYIQALNAGHLTVPDWASAWRQDGFVRAYQSQLLGLIGLSRPVEWNQLQRQLEDVIKLEVHARGRPQYGLLFQWLLSDAPAGWLTRYFHEDHKLPYRLNAAARSPLPASEIALLLACHRPADGTVSRN